jgi:hypothetical protein
MGCVYLVDGVVMKDVDELRDYLAARGRGSRFSVSQKPKRIDGETSADYAKRIMEWRKTQLDETFMKEARKDIRSESAEEVEYVKQLKEGKKLLSSNPNMPIAEFNQKLGLPAGDYETYVASLKEAIADKTVDKVSGQKILQDIRNQDPNKVLMSEIKLLKLKFQAESRGARAGYKEAQKESKQALAEFRTAQREKTKERIEKTKQRYQKKLDDEKQKRQNLIAKQKKFREDIASLLHDVNELDLFEGKKFSASEVLKLANAVNKVITTRTFDKLTDLVNEMITDADKVKKVLQAKSLITDVRKLLKSDAITANDISVLRDLISLNPDSVHDIDTLNKMLSDIVSSRYADPSPLRTYSNDTIKKFVEQEQENELKDIVDDADTSYREFFDEAGKAGFFKNNVMLGFPKPDAFRTALEGIGVDPSRNHRERKRALNQYDEFVSVMKQYNEDYQDIMEKHGAEFKDLPQIDIADVLGDITNPTANISSAGTNRQVLEDMARDVQSVIDPTDPNYKKWQQDLLAKMKDLDVSGMTSSNLRLFMNVVNNVVDNEDESGSGIFEAMWEGNNQEAKGFLDFLGKTGYMVRERMERHNVRKKLRGLKEGLSSTEMMFMQIANNSPKLATALYNMIRMNELKKGNVKTLQDLEEQVVKPMGELFSKGLRQDADANIRLTIYSRLRQSKETQSPTEAQKEFVKRFNEIERDAEVKEQFGKEDDKKEAALIRGVLADMKEKIEKATGIDISQTKEGLDPSVLDTIDFLTPQQKEAYQVMRDFYDKTRPQFERLMTKYLNEQFEAWNNYMPDTHRKLRGGIINEDINGENFGNSIYMRVANPMNAIAGSTMTRVKGNRIVEPKSGEDTNVINYNWFGNNKDNAEEMLFDNNTLEHRMVADNVFKNKDVEEAVGTGNMEVMKQAYVKELRAMTGLFGKNAAMWFTLMKDATDTFTSVAAKVQLYSLGAFFKQSLSAYANTALFLGTDSKNLPHAVWTYETNQDAQRLVSQEEVAIRGTTKAGTNIQSARNISEIDQRVTGSDWYGTYKNLVDKINSRNNLTGEEKKLMGWFLEQGDVIGARGSWLALYGTWLVKNGKYKSFSDIDWKKEADTPTREAEAYAQVATARQLNVNSRNALGEALTTPDAASSILKALYGLFAMFGFNKSIYLWNNLKTLTNGRPDSMNDEQRKEELKYAMKSFAAGAAEEFMYQSVKAIWVKLTLLPLFGLLLGALGEDDKTIEKITGSYNKGLFKKILSNTVSNYLFSFAGNTGQLYINEWMNDLYEQFGGKGKVFYEPPTNPNFQANNGLFGATFQDLYQTSKDWMRINFDRTNPYHDSVAPPSTREQLWHATSFLHNLLQMTKLGDADLGRLIKNRMGIMRQDIQKRYQDPYYVDIYELANKPRTLSIANRSILLNETDWDFYRDRFQERIEELRHTPDSRMNKSAKQRDASDYAKRRLLHEYGLGYLLRFEYDDAKKAYKKPDMAK